MKNPPIHWHEGQFLLPHHLQAADRYWTDLTSTSQQWDHPYNYGLHEFHGGFEGTLFRVDKIHARLRDGTLVCREENDPPLTVELDEVLDEDRPVRIYLCVPKLRPRDVNIRAAAGDRPVRYATVMRDMYDENQSGGNEKEIECRDLSVRLMLAGDDRDGYEQLPIAQVKRSTGDTASPQLDEHFIPPVLGINAWLQLGKGFVRGIHDLMIQHINELTDMLHDVRLRDHILEVTQSGRFALLDRLNQSAAALGVMVPGSEVHPFHPLAAYAELCRLVGALAIFTEEKRAPPLPSYNHDNLGPIYREVTALIRLILESIQFNECRRKNLVWEGDIMQADLTPFWFDSRVEWYIGVDRPEQVSDTECRRLLSTDNQFLWKLGSKDRDIYRLQAIGLQLKEVDPGTQPAELPPHQYWSYWRVPKNDSDPVMRAVAKTQMIAAFVRDGKDQQFDLSQYSGTSRFRVVDSHGEPIEFQVALFGIRR